MEKQSFLKHLWTILLSFVVFVLSVIPVPEVKPLEGVPLIDKWVHFIMYGGIALAVWLDFYLATKKKAEAPKSLLPVFLFSTVFPILLGGFLELWQSYLTTCRSGEWLDFIADSLGAVIAQPIAFIAWRVKHHSSRSN